MDFIYREMYDAMIARGTVPYAPYIMLLIKDTLRSADLSDSCDVEHKMKKPYKLKGKQTATFPTASSTSGFMRDARRGGGLSRQDPTHAIGKEVKKLSWWQKYVLCMNTEVHKENYQAYRERRELFHQNATILHHLTKASGPPPQQTAPIAYKHWNNAKIDWVDLEKHLYGAEPSLVSTPPPADDDEEEEYEPDGDDGEDDDAEATESESAQTYA